MIKGNLCISFCDLYIHTLFIFLNWIIGLFSYQFLFYVLGKPTVLWYGV